MRGPLPALTLVGVLLAATGAPHAAVVRPLSLKDMASVADVVVTGRVQAVVPQWLQGRIFRKVTLIAERVLKGRLKPGQPVVVWVPGGEVGEIGQWVPGAPEFEVGDDPVLFLEARSIGHVVVGMSLGKLRIERDDAGAAWVVRQTDGELQAPSLRVSWELFEATVRSAG